MNDTVRHARQIESEFLAGVRENLEHALGTVLPGTSWQQSMDDERRQLEALLSAHHRHDARLLTQLPCNRRITVRGFRRRWWFGRRRTMVAVATVLTPLEHIAADLPGPPIELGALVDHLRTVVTDTDVPHVIGVCAPSGFSEEVRRSQLALPNVSVILIEPHGEGQWQITSLDEDLPPAVPALFNPEAMSGKLAAVRREIAQRQADLLLGGISAVELAGRTGVPSALVDELFEQTADAAADVHVERSGGEVRLLQGPAAARSSIMDRIRNLFDREGDEATKISMLTEQRAHLRQRQEQCCARIEDLERQEQSLLEQGRQAESLSQRRRYASRLAQLRKDIARQNAIIQLLNSQIDIVGTDLHHLTLLQQGRMIALPDTAALTRNAVRAQQMLETLREGTDLVSSLARDNDLTVRAEEDAILEEFNTAARRASDSGPLAADHRPAEEAVPFEPPAPDRRRDAEPED